MNTIKKYLLALLLTAAVGLSATAKPVQPATALRVAQTFMSLNGFSGQLSDVTAQTPFTLFYLFTAEDGGFVLVSGDDCALPILGFSTVNPFDAKRIPDNVRRQLELYEAELRQLATASGQQPADEWQALLSGVLPAPPSPTAVAPLVSTTWAQSPYYNNLCPYHTASGQRSVTGCVATATAQIMKKWNHPATGYGSNTYTSDRTVNGVNYNFPNLTANFGTTTYQWSSMPTALSATSSIAQVNAVATLMYHVGVAVEMLYSPVASGAWNYNYEVVYPSAETALQKYFKYRSDMAALYRGDYTNAEWLALLKAELDLGRPILLDGSDPTGGHSFVCDGYNNSNQFHINWGWDSYCDGYYTMGALNPASGGTGGNNGTYNDDNVALVGIQPNTAWSATGTTAVTATATGGTGCTVIGAGSYSYGDTVELYAQAASGYRFDRWSDGHKFNPRHCIANGGSLSFTAQFVSIAGDTITYCPGNRHLTSWGGYGSTTWGIRIPAASMQAGEPLNAVQFFASATGSHTLTVYSGTASPSTTLFTTTVNVTEDEAWQTVAVSGVTVPAGADLWVMLSSTEPYPAAVTYGSGNEYARVWGSNFGTLSNSTYYTFMVRALFSDGGGDTPGDTTATADDCIISSFPFTETFDDTSTYHCLGVYDANGDTVSWGLIDSFGVSYSRAAYIMYAVNADDYLFMPAIVAPGNYTVSWKAKAYQASYPETYQVMAGDSVIFSETISATSYLTRSASFSVAQGDTVRIAFRYISNDMYVFFLDNITIDQATDPNPPQPVDCTVSAFPYTMGFEEDEMDAFYNCWSTIDADGDGSTWGIVESGSNNFVGSASYENGVGPLTPDNWLVSPQFALAAGAGYSLSWVVSAPDSNYYAEHYGLFVSTSGTDTSDFTLLQQYTLATHLPTTVTVDLSAYAGQNVRLAFRHWDITDIYWLFIDNFTLTATVDTTGPNPPAQYTVTVLSADSTMGTVSGGGTYDVGTVITLSATAYTGYRFVQWNDGDTQATRTVTVTHDATYTATFAADQMVTVTVLSADSTMGTVSGGGTYDVGTVITLSATAYTGYHFVQWNDGDTHAIRTVTVTADVTYIATFAADEDPNGIDGPLSAPEVQFTVYPNPASGVVTVVWSGDGVALPAAVEIVDLTGRKVCTAQLSASCQLDVSAIAPGTYFLRIAGTVGKLIIR